jgi:hypothetical protein
LRELFDEAWGVGAFFEAVREAAGSASFAVALRGRR